VRALALIPSSALRLDTEDRFLMVVQQVPPVLAANALAVQAAYREYQQRALAREGLRRMYVGTLTLTLILAVFGAVLLAAMLGHQLARPLLLLAQGVRQVAAGDLGTKPVFASRDELGGLTRSFADMTQQLADARAQVQRGVAQLAAAHTNLQTILDSLTAGVIVFDRERRIDTVNPGATRILKQPLSAYRGRPLDEVPGLADFARDVWQRFDTHRDSPEAGERDHWQDAFELPQVADGLLLLVRGASLPQDARLMVFDDITEVVSAQRAAAWSEVARRLAHEIKNPLTPIQLSAERLQFKLSDKLANGDADMLARGTQTIINQVQAMKRMVDDFRDYARLPAPELAPLDLNGLIGEVLGLYESSTATIASDLAEGMPPVLGDQTQLRQIIHNLLRNAEDALEGRPDARIEICTTAGTRNARLTITDNGPGFPVELLPRIFEPYVTTKARGTGLGLPIVKKIVDEHQGIIEISNAPEGGARIEIRLPLVKEEEAKHGHHSGR
jgi:nitrogen fixation/metabolism regulation signal transduction histidine kinase